MRGPCAGPGASAGRRHAPPGCFCAGTVFLYLLCGPSGGPSGGALVSGSGHLYPGQRQALGGKDRPASRCPAGAGAAGGSGGRGELQRPSEGLYRGGTPAGGVAVSPEEKMDHNPIRLPAQSRRQNRAHRGTLRLCRGSYGLCPPEGQVCPHAGGPAGAAVQPGLLYGEGAVLLYRGHGCGGAAAGEAGVPFAPGPASAPLPGDCSGEAGGATDPKRRSGGRL